MNVWRSARRVGALAVVCLLAVAGEGLSADRPSSKQTRVSMDEYPVYSHVIETKFLTSQTETVLIGRLTKVRLGPGEQDIPSQAYFRDRHPFEGGLEPELVTDFILKNSKQARLEDKLSLEVPYRFVSDEGIEEPEVSLAPIPASFPTWTQTAPSVVGVLGLSRVGFSPRSDQALVYVEANRPDGSGSGFLMWLRRQDVGWEFLDTEVLWIARPE